MSCIVMLVINPYFLVYDVGFLLSYSAIIGLIYFGTRNEGKGEREEKVKGEVINPPVLRTTPPLLPLKTGQAPEDKTKQNIIIKALQYTYKSYISPSI